LEWEDFAKEFLDFLLLLPVIPSLLGNKFDLYKEEDKVWDFTLK